MPMTKNGKSIPTAKKNPIVFTEATTAKPVVQPAGMLPTGGTVPSEIISGL